MTEREFTAWAAAGGVPDQTTKAILRFAATPEEIEEVCNAMDPLPPVYTLADIVSLTDTDPYRISPRDNGFILVGGCPNDDLVAIDMANQPGTVWYICHETMHERPLREASVRVTRDLPELFDGLANGSVPFDYAEAKGRAERAGN